MQHLPQRLLRTLVGAVLISPFAPLASAQTARESFFEAYYLQHERGDLQGAVELYRKVASHAGAPQAMRAEAERFSHEVHEDLAAQDLARLVPAESLVYLELRQPGARLESLLSQLGLLQGSDQESRLGISPSLVRGLLGLRGAALALTEIDPNGRREPSGVVVLHPGDLELVRGLIETALPAGGRPVAPIAGRETYSIEGEAFVTLGSRLVVFSNERHLIEGVLARADGHGSPSLADSDAMADLARMRGEDLAYFCVNAGPWMPRLMEMLDHEAQSDPGLAVALDLADLASLRGIAGRIGVEQDGLALDLALEMADDHRSLPFNLLRMPHLEASSFDLVPAGAAAFLATALNHEAQLGEGTRSGDGRPVVTLMDFGRELFGNIVDIAFFALPPEAGMASLPPVALALRVNDVERSRGLWQMCLALATQAASEGRVQPESVDVGGFDAERYSIQGFPIYFAAQDGHVLVTPSPDVLEATLVALEEGDSVRRDPAFARALAGTEQGHTLAVMVHPGRLARLARPFVQGDEGEAIEIAAELLAHSTLSMSLEHSASRLGFAARFYGLPNVGPLVEEALQRHGPRRQPGHGGGRQASLDEGVDAHPAHHGSH